MDRSTSKASAPGALTNVNFPAAAASAATRPARAFDLVAPHVKFALLVLAALTVCRLGFTAAYRDRVPSTDAVFQILVGGLRMDVVIVSYVLAPALLVALLFGGWKYGGTFAATFLRLYFTAMTVAFLFFEIVTPAFVAEYDSRPNRLFIEYLVHPREVSAMLINGYLTEIVITSVLTSIVTFMAWRWYGRATASLPRASVLARVGLFLALGPLVFIGARSSLQHRPANPSSVAFSEDHLLNDLPLSSFYSVAYAAAQMQSEADASDVYGFLENDQAVIDEVRRAMVTVPPDAFKSDELPTLHYQQATRSPSRPLNLVIILQESLGAQFIGALGGKPITQFIDTLRDQSWWFDHMYATGTRSVRGIEAVVAGYLPTPARSVVKLGLSQQGFFTIAEFLGARGYRTQFLYGGESHFDNMKRFFTGNGFREIIDRDDFENPTFAGSWGVCDGDMFAKLDELLTSAGDQPIFTLAFSVSNHTPWEYPIGGFTPYDEDPATVGNSVRYADYALGQFFEKARKSSYWANTVFAIVADHDSRVYGASLVPIQHFHIPAVILGAGIEPRVDQRIASQIDLPPTLLSLIGASGEHPMVGFDLTALPADAPGRAIMQYDKNQAYMEGNRVVVLQPRLPATHSTWDGENYVPAEPDPAMERRALAHALLPSLLYRELRYRAQ